MLTARAFLVEKITATENSLRAALRNFGLKMGAVTRPKWEARARELAAGQEVLEQIIEAMLRVRALLLEELASVEGRLVALAKSDPVTRLLMTVPGVGVVVALSFQCSRRPCAVPANARRRCVAWTDATPMAIGQDRHRRPHHEGRRRAGAHDAVRSGGVHSRTGAPHVAPEGVGAAHREADLHEESDRGRGAQAGDDAARHVEIRNGVLGDAEQPGFRKGPLPRMKHKSSSTRAPPF